MNVKFLINKVRWNVNINDFIDEIPHKQNECKLLIWNSGVHFKLLIV